MMESIIIAIAAGSASGGLVFWWAASTLARRLRKEIANEYSRNVEDHVRHLESDLKHLVDKYKEDLSEEQRVRQERWEAKRKACLHALKVVDAYYSNLDWDEDVEKQLAPNIAVARECYNQLALSCRNEKVLLAYKRCLGFYGPIQEELLVDLRNAIREELDFEQSLESDRERPWLTKLHRNEALPESTADEG